MKKLMTLAIILGAALLVGSSTIPTGSASGSAAPVANQTNRVVLHGNVHPLARSGFDVGRTEGSLPMNHMILSLKLAPEKKAALDNLLAEQQDPASPNYHHWLTPEEFGKQFGQTPDEIAKVTNWLRSMGFKIDEVAKSGTWINFSGTASTVETAFQTQMHDYMVNDRLHHANSLSPSIPVELASLVNGVVSLHNFRHKPMHTNLQPLPEVMYQPNFTAGDGSHYLAPADFATIYNVQSLYDAGIDGTGQTIAIVGRTHPATATSDWAAFRSQFGLPANPPQIVLNGTDPGDQGQDEDGEANLDVEWAGAVAKNATIKFVVSASTNSSDGVDLSAAYIVNHNLAPVMSTSFGSCESDMGASENQFYNNLWAQAATEGITAFVSSGDSGASGCDGGSSTSGTGPAVNGLSSTPYNVAVGGTELSEGSGTYWSSNNSGDYSSAQSYIPEAAWNESARNGGSGLWSTGGGVSMYYHKPAWQVAPGVPSDGWRDVPDVALTSAVHDGYLTYGNGSFWITGGTSASSPSFAGLMALVVQKTGQPQGSANARLYELANDQYGSGGPTVFHDTLSGNNSVPNVNGYSCTTGYDLATGLGSVDATALVNNWSQGIPSNPVADFTANPTSGTAPLKVQFQDASTSQDPLSSWSWNFGDGTGTSTAQNPSYTYTNPGTYDVSLTVTDSNGASSTKKKQALITISAPTLANLKPYTPSGWSDSIVVSNVQGTTTDSSNLKSTDKLYVDWAVINNGQASVTTPFQITLAVDGNVAKIWTFPASSSSPLKSGYYTYVKDFSLGSLSAGSHTLTLTADSTNAVQESNENDNAYTKKITILSLAPGAPTGVTAIAGNGLAKVSFSPPGYIGASRITSYIVTSIPGGFTASGSASPITVRRLTNGTPYTFTVRAKNAKGTGDPSDPSNPVTPAGAPGAPTGVTATAGNGQAIVSFSPPSDGGSPITSYIVKSSPLNITASGTGSPVTVSGLRNGTGYTFTVKAVNAIGSGPVSRPSNRVIPSPTAAAPRNVRAKAGRRPSEG